MLKQLSDKAKNRIIVGLAVASCMLFALTFHPVRAAVNRIIPFGFVDCCQGEVCCPNCCWFVPNCDDSGDCTP